VIGSNKTIKQNINWKIAGPLMVAILVGAFGVWKLSGSSATTTHSNKIYTINIGSHPIDGSQFHTKNRALENSIQGVQKAHKKGLKAIDLDINKSKDGVLFAAHSPGLVGKTWNQVKKNNPHRKYKISKLSDLLREVAKYHLQANLDIKPWGNKWDDATFASIAKMANKINVKVTIKASTNDKKLAKALSLAQAHGFWVRSNAGTFKGKKLSGNGWKPGVWVKPTTTVH